LCLVLAACGTTSSYETTYTAADYAGYGPSGSVVAGRHGRVEAVRERVHVTQGQPLFGAAVGSLIGGVVTGSWWGAAAGGATGGLLSSGGGESRDYEVVVRFDDGTAQPFMFPDYAPFQPGQLVVQTPSGLQAAG
jgi:hypothetical protein